MSQLSREPTGIQSTGDALNAGFQQAAQSFLPRDLHPPRSNFHRYSSSPLSLISTNPRCLSLFSAIPPPRQAADRVSLRHQKVRKLNWRNWIFHTGARNQMIPAVINLARKSKPVEEPEEAVNLRGRGRVADVAVTNGGQQACLHKGVSSFWIIWRMPKGQLYIRWLSFPIDPLDRRIPSSVQLSFSRKERRRFFAKRR